MKAVILAGGLGTRLAEETEIRPKPLVEIGGRPILWHIMKHFARHGVKEFVVALGYKGEMIKQFFADYCSLESDVTVDLGSGKVTPHQQAREDWVVHLVDTGDATQTGGRIKRLEPWLKSDAFMMTYGDGVSNVDLGALLQFHKRCGRLATLTAVRPPARYGGVVFEGDLVGSFTEKPQVGEGWINGGFMVFEPGILKRLDGDNCYLEHEVLEGLALDRQLAAYRHEGFWQCMDTLRDKRQLEHLWQAGAAEWKTWE